MTNFDCPRCKALTQYKLTPVTANPSGEYGESLMNVWLQCTSCSFIFGGVVDSSSHKKLIDWWPRRIVFRRFPDVPEHIAASASEAYTCLGAGAYRAAGAMARAVIEATAKDKGITQGQIHSKIETLYDQRLIREHVRDAAHEVRHFGNDMAHGDFVDPVDEDEAEAILDLMSEVLNEVFQSPARVEKTKAARLAKREAAG